ncbi:MAG: glycosyl hydrolase family 28-related protein [Kiritimatiellae bacterium]|nr:glycosyl hydrolase family 28-related protein [Kiritimatiellia bacterium]
MDRFHARFFALTCMLALLAIMSAAGEGPQVFWASDPVRPGETVVLMGESFTTNMVVELAQVTEKQGPSLAGSAFSEAQVKVVLKPLQASEQSLKAAVPNTWTQGVWAVRVSGQDAVVSKSVLLNAPTVWWWNGDGGEFSTPGGWLRVFGKALNFGGQSRAQLKNGEGRILELMPHRSSGYALAFDLPPEIAPGDYELLVDNGLGGGAAWCNAGTVLIRQPRAWKGDIFNIKDFDPNPAEALLAALKAAETNGGGIVYLPRGRYPVKDTLRIPTNTVLRGEAMELTSIYWPEHLENPPPVMISGADFGIESLSIYCTNHRRIISDTDNSKRVFLRKVRIRANAYFMVEDRGKEFRGHKGPATHRACGEVIMLRGKNFEVTECDIYATHTGIRVFHGKTGIIARNTIRYGGRGYSIEGTERLIFEDNLIAGNNLLAIGNDITTFWSNSCKHIYFAHNHLQLMFGADREMMTLDAGAGAYFGKVASANGVQLKLAEDPTFKDAAPIARTNWVGSVVQIVAGRGCGQYRFVTGHTGRHWQVDQHWTVLPDTTSLITIAAFRGRNLFVGNTCEDGGPFQLFGAAHDTIIAENKGARMDGFIVWATSGAYHPSWFCQLFDNEILEGNGYGNRKSGFGTVSRAGTNYGPMVRGTIFRRNVIHNNANFFVNQMTDDTLIENCVVRNSEIGISIRATARGTLLRGNIFEGVAQPVQNERTTESESGK